MGRPLGSKNHPRNKIEFVIDYYECDYCHRRIIKQEFESAKFDRCLCNRRLDAFKIIRKFK